MYQASVPAFVQMLTALSKMLDKAEINASERGIEETVLLGTRLSPDMFALARQVQIATDHAKGAMSRLAGLEPPSYADDETSLAALRARIAKTLDHVQSFKPEQIEGSEDRDVSLKIGGTLMEFKGQTYLVNFALPNFYFHITTAYAILRQCGVPIGKRDFMGVA